MPSCDRRCGGSWWAHQDSNLERAGYEPAALTVELWARSIVAQKLRPPSSVLRPPCRMSTPMNVDLERVIALQRLDSEAGAARKKLAEAPDREKAFDERLEAAKQRLAGAKAQLAANQEARRGIEKEVAVHQGRLSKYRDQAMAVKTNQEYHAIQHEIAHAQGEIGKYEDQILERMVEADDLAATIKAAEAALASEQKTIDADRKRMQAEDAGLQSSLDTLGSERAGVIAALDKRVLAVYDTAFARRQGVAVAEAKDGICTICHVRLRPQVFNDVRRNEAIVQCDSCQRILYFVAAPATQAS